MLSAAETARLGEGQLIEVGAHTMTHPVLSRLSLADQQDEIQQSKSRLEELIGRPVNSFAYPHGLSSDFTQETAALVRDAGFDCGCAAMPGIVQRDTSAYQLPRLTVRDEDGDQFAERLSSYFRG
jgi:peptidoglycan/xylan/chitin deacetylase (PgdA/CDA1 family)